jgi:hypothetical protein
VKSVKKMLIARTRVNDTSHIQREFPNSECLVTI